MSYSAVYGMLWRDNIDQALNDRKVKAQVATTDRNGEVYVFVSCPINFSRPYPDLKFLCDFVVDAKYFRRISAADMVDFRHTYLVGDKTKLDESAAQDLVKISESIYGPNARMSGWTEVGRGSHNSRIMQPDIPGTRFMHRPQAPNLLRQSVLPV